jgi:hypothetical protein
MPRLAPTLQRAARALRATLLLGVLVVGATCHFWHHVQDPECGSGFDRSNHVCTACSGLHGSTLVAAPTCAPTPRPVEWTEPELPAAPAFAAAELASAAPRAPPVS